jgi:exodeoxyribonuclease VII small subunit
MTAKRVEKTGADTGSAGAAQGGGQEPGFEKALERLEKVVGEMENGRLTLEEMIARFEEGQSLISVCARKLNEVERKIDILIKEGEKVREVAFDEKAVEKDEPGASASRDDAAPF